MTSSETEFRKVKLTLGEVIAEIDALVALRFYPDHRYGSAPYERERGEMNMARLIREAVVARAREKAEG